MKSAVMTIALLTCSFASGLAFAERFDRTNSPLFFSKFTGTQMNLELAALPLKAKIKDESLVWSGSYWPNQRGGTAFRWAHPNPNSSNALLTKTEVEALSVEELSQLSPTELYDIAMGDYTYTITNYVRSRVKPNDQWWLGINHGWAQASSHYAIPKSTTVVNPDGLEVPFSSTDVAALISLHEAYNYSNTAAFAFAGSRCQVSGKVEGESTEQDINPNYPSLEEANSKNCKDVNAGAFHIILSNMIGIHSQSFVADLDRFGDVLNHPVKAYETKLLNTVEVSKEDTALGIVKKIVVSTNMTVANTVEAGGPFDAELVKTYVYILELDSEGKVVGGEWIGQSRPDFLWKYSRTEFNNRRIPLEGLNKIYQ